ncbi:VQ motif-containing protein 25 [Striga hermonthica]|uniref:VQ motif-containing protein 25 n=1 Tax=Striga hermonthica TaxID=68872 RepID=A0A9N7MP43_STRHE|nr:VQ motif-containing protein 25 [Striga hermonthica]
MHKNSQTISKSKPKIRIIHIFAPEIIKTDAENFRELVQRLTGKPTDGDQSKRAMKRSSRRNEQKKFGSTKKELHEEFRERIKGEEEIWRVANSGGGFLGGFGDQLEYGFMHELNQFPFLEGTTQMDAYGETVQSAQ